MSSSKTKKALQWEDEVTTQLIACVGSNDPKPLQTALLNLVQEASAYMDICVEGKKFQAAKRLYTRLKQILAHVELRKMNLRVDTSRPSLVDLTVAILSIMLDLNIFLTGRPKKPLPKDEAASRVIQDTLLFIGGHTNHLWDLLLQSVALKDRQDKQVGFWILERLMEESSWNEPLEVEAYLKCLLCMRLLYQHSNKEQKGQVRLQALSMSVPKHLYRWLKAHPVPDMPRLAKREPHKTFVKPFLKNMDRMTADALCQILSEDISVTESDSAPESDTSLVNIFSPSFEPHNDDDKNEQSLFVMDRNRRGSSQTESERIYEQIHKDLAENPDLSARTRVSRNAEVFLTDSEDETTSSYTHTRADTILEGSDDNVDFKTRQQQQAKSDFTSTGSFYLSDDSVRIDDDNVQTSDEPQPEKQKVLKRTRGVSEEHETRSKKHKINITECQNVSTYNDRHEDEDSNSTVENMDVRRVSGVLYSALRKNQSGVDKSSPSPKKSRSPEKLLHTECTDSQITVEAYDHILYTPKKELEDKDEKSNENTTRSRRRTASSETSNLSADELYLADASCQTNLSSEEITGPKNFEKILAPSESIITANFLQVDRNVESSQELFLTQPSCDFATQMSDKSSEEFLSPQTSPESSLTGSPKQAVKSDLTFSGKLTPPLTEQFVRESPRTKKESTSFQNTPTRVCRSVETTPRKLRCSASPKKVSKILISNESNDALALMMDTSVEEPIKKRFSPSKCTGNDVIMLIDCQAGHVKATSCKLEHDSDTTVPECSSDNENVSPRRSVRNRMSPRKNSVAVEHEKATRCKLEYDSDTTVPECSSDNEKVSPKRSKVRNRMSPRKNSVAVEHEKAACCNLERDSDTTVPECSSDNEKVSPKCSKVRNRMSPRKNSVAVEHEKAACCNLERDSDTTVPECSSDNEKVSPKCSKVRNCMSPRKNSVAVEHEKLEQDSDTTVPECSSDNEKVSPKHSKVRNRMSLRKNSVVSNTRPENIEKAISDDKNIPDEKLPGVEDSRTQPKSAPCIEMSEFTALNADDKIKEVCEVKPYCLRTRKERSSPVKSGKTDKRSQSSKQSSESTEEKMSLDTCNNPETKIPTKNALLVKRTQSKSENKSSVGETDFVSKTVEPDVPSPVKRDLAIQEMQKYNLNVESYLQSLESQKELDTPKRHKSTSLSVDAEDLDCSGRISRCSVEIERLISPKQHRSLLMSSDDEDDVSSTETLPNSTNREPDICPKITQSLSTSSSHGRLSKLNAMSTIVYTSSDSEIQFQSPPIRLSGSESDVSKNLEKTIKCDSTITSTPLTSTPANSVGKTLTPTSDVSCQTVLQSRHIAMLVPKIKSRRKGMAPSRSLRLRSPKTPATKLKASERGAASQGTETPLSQTDRMTRSNAKASLRTTRSRKTYCTPIMTSPTKESTSPAKNQPADLPLIPGSVRRSTRKTPRTKP